MLKHIKLKFVNFWPGFDEKNNVFIDILKEYFEIEFSDQPDYIFCSCFGVPYEYLKYEGIRIFYAGENISPDWNTVDYALGYDPMIYGDRYFRLPVYWLYRESVKKAAQKHLNITPELLNTKKFFCNFIYGNTLGQPFRKDFFEFLQQYKPIVSAGCWLNNMPNGTVVHGSAEKLPLQQKCKFTLAVDSIRQNGFVTEKILDAFAAQTIPIYCGNPEIEKDFNIKAFINAKDFDYDFERILAEIKRIDQNDDEYLSMLSEPAFAKENMPAVKEEGLEFFLKNIFEQNKDDAVRTSRKFWSKKVIEWQKEYATLCKLHIPFHEGYNFIEKVRNKIERLKEKKV